MTNCGDYCGTGQKNPQEATAICGRYAGHPPVSDDDISHWGPGDERFTRNPDFNRKKPKGPSGAQREKEGGILRFSGEVQVSTERKGVGAVTVHRGVATREGDWWMVVFKELGPAYVTQGRDEEDAKAMARGLIAVKLQVNPDSFAVEIDFKEQNPAPTGEVE